MDEESDILRVFLQIGQNDIVLGEQWDAFGEILVGELHKWMWNICLQIVIYRHDNDRLSLVPIPAVHWLLQSYVSFGQGHFKEWIVRFRSVVPQATSSSLLFEDDNLVEDSLCKNISAKA